jgi:tRNA(Arg) A34 adenosine deaminase TadA
MLTPLDAPMAVALDLAWQSFRAGSLGVGATIISGDDVIATGRNRLFENDPGDDALAGTSLAHAETNALAKLRWGRHRDEHVELWTTLQPCLQCLGAIRLSAVNVVHVLAPDPLFRGVERVRHLNEFLARNWPTMIERPVDEWAVLSLLMPTHVATFWRAQVPGWDEALPDVARLAGALVASGEMVELAVNEPSIAAVAEKLWPRLSACVGEVVDLAAQQ